MDSVPIFRPPVSTEFADPSSHHNCPACGGVLVPLGSLLRCSRCRFAICNGCEGGESPPQSIGEHSL